MHHQIKYFLLLLILVGSSFYIKGGDEGASSSNKNNYTYWIAPFAAGAAVFGLTAFCVHKGYIKDDYTIGRAASLLLPMTAAFYTQSRKKSEPINSVSQAAGHTYVLPSTNKRTREEL